MALMGVDISVYQGNIDWATVAEQQIFYGFAKATEGVTTRDDQFDRNWASMASVGIVRGAYHFFRPGRDAIAQANHFLQVVKTIGASDLPPVLDLEINDGLDAGAVIDQALVWLNTITAKTGRRPILYTFPNFWEEKLGSPSQFVDYPLWIANFGANQPYVPRPWRQWTFHQYSESGVLRGIEGNVDLNRFNGGLDELQRLLKGRVPLRQGSTGNVVRELQNLLAAQGFSIGTADGQFGAQTKLVVINFQRSRNLYADGIVGAATWAALDRNGSISNPNPDPAINLVNVCKSYRGGTHQDQALNWLQSQVPHSTLEEFAKRWRNQPLG